MRFGHVVIPAIALALALSCAVPTPAPTPTPPPTSKPIPTTMPIDYTSLSLSTIDRTNEVRLKPKVVKLMGETIEQEPEAMAFGIANSIGSLQPGKGEDAIILVVRIANAKDHYMFPLVMPGWLKDTKGQEYREQGDAVRGEPKTAQSSYTEILTKELGWVKVIHSSDATQDIIAPGESYDWVFIFHIPNERSLSEFSFRYDVGETANPLVGQRQKGLSSIAIAEKGH